MLGTRYEEYTNFDDNLPFKLLIGKTITPTTYSHEANWHENLEIQICTEGKGIVQLDEKRYSVTKDDIIVVNSNVIHHINSSSMVKYNCLIIDSAFCRQAAISHTNLYFNPYIRSCSLERLFKTLEYTYINNNDVSRIARMEIIILEMLIELQENHIIAENTNETKKHSFETVKNTISFIRDNYSKKLSLDEISRAVFMDKYNLSREFKSITNQTIVQYINNYRCMKAADYISDGKSVSDAAKMCGFSNMSFFTKTFKQYMGKLPSKHKSQSESTTAYN